MAMKVGDAKSTPLCGDRIVITGDYPDNGKAYQIKELRENGWILTTNHRLFHEEFFELCPLPNSTFAQEWARVSHFQALSQEALNSSDSQKLTNIAQTSYQNDSPVLPITETCDRSQSKILDDNGISTSLVVVHPVSRLVCKENAREEMTQETVYPPSRERSHLSNLDSSVSKTSQDCSTVPKTLKVLGYISELSLVSFPKSGTMRNGLLYQADTLAAPSLEKGYCWLESPGALSSGNGRPPGQSRLEGQLKKLGVLERREVLNPQFLEKAYSLPLNWTNPQELRAATELLEIDEKPLEMHSIQEWERSPSEESFISIPSNSFLGESDGDLLGSSQIFLGENSGQEDRTSKISPKKKTDDPNPSEIFLGENDQPQTMKQISPKKNPSGSLYAFIQDKKDKHGNVKTYPKVIGDRSPDNPDHWFWAYCWDEKVNGKWKTFKRSVAREKLEDVREAIASNRPIEEILEIIK